MAAAPCVLWASAQCHRLVLFRLLEAPPEQKPVSQLACHNVSQSGGSSKFIARVTIPVGVLRAVIAVGKDGESGQFPELQVA